jgi:hypothetical protein
MRRHFARAAAVAFASLLMTGCIGYHASKQRYSPGYSEEQVSGGVFRITYNGPGRTSESLLRANVERRAAELCPSGFSLTDYVYDRVDVIHGDPSFYNVATAVARCNPRD